MFDVEIVERPARRVIGVPHRGPYNRIGGAFERLSGMVGDAGLWPEAVEFLGLYLDDPAEVPEAELRSLAGIAVRGDLEAPEGFEQAQLAAGRYAVLHHRGPYDGLPAAWRWFYAEWLPQSRMRTGSGAACEIYRNAPDHVAAADLLTDICVPLA